VEKTPLYRLAPKFAWWVVFPNFSRVQSFNLKFLEVTILQGSNFPFLLIFAWPLQECSATVLPVISYLSHTKFSQLTNLNISTTWSLLNFTTTLILHLRSHARPTRTGSGEEPVTLWNDLSPYLITNGSFLHAAYFIRLFTTMAERRKNRRQNTQTETDSTLVHKINLQYGSNMTDA